VIEYYRTTLDFIKDRFVLGAILVGLGLLKVDTIISLAKICT